MTDEIAEEYPELEVERKNISFTIDSTPNDRVQDSLRVAAHEKERLEELAEEQGFPSRSAFIRTMVYLGLNTFVEQHPSNTETEHENETDAVTIRELVPEGEENAVGLTDEFLEDIVKERMIDIVENDPEIERDGLKIYR